MLSSNIVTTDKDRKRNSKSSISELDTSTETITKEEEQTLTRRELNYRYNKRITKDKQIIMSYHER